MAQLSSLESEERYHSIPPTHVQITRIDLVYPLSQKRNIDHHFSRHHTYSSIDGQVELQEVGPRFELKLYDIKLGSIDEAAALDSEWSFKPFMNTTRKRLFLGEPSELADGR